MSWNSLARSRKGEHCDFVGELPVPTIRIVVPPHRDWERIVDVVVVMLCEANLFKIVLALRSACSFASLLHRWEQQCDQDGNDRNHYQQFDQRKR